MSFSHGASSSIWTSNADERHVIPKSDEFLSLIKFDVWFCDSLVHLSDSKSIHWQNQRHQWTHCAVVRSIDALSYTVSVSQFCLQLIQIRNRPTLFRKFSNKFLAPLFLNLYKFSIKIRSSTFYTKFHFVSSAILFRLRNDLLCRVGR